MDSDLDKLSLDKVPGIRQVFSLSLLHTTSFLTYTINKKQLRMPKSTFPLTVLRVEIVG